MILKHSVTAVQRGIRYKERLRVDGDVYRSGPGQSGTVIEALNWSSRGGAAVRGGGVHRGGAGPATEFKVRVGAGAHHILYRKY